MVDMIVLILFWTLFRFFVNVKIEQRANDAGLDDFTGLSKKQIIIIVWIITLLVINIFYLLFKCFGRAISNLTDLNSESDGDVFDTMHKNRFLFFSIVDLLNGLTVLYSFYCMADLSNNHKNKAKPVTVVTMKISANGTKLHKKKTKKRP